MRWSVALLGLGCVGGPGETELPERALERFTAEVQPVLAEACANPTCHGHEDRPLRIYAPMRHRLRPEEVLADTPLDTDELQLNYDRVLGFLDDADPGRSMLLLKPLAPDAGGAEHEGGEVFADETDRGYAALRAWVAGEEVPP